MQCRRASRRITLLVVAVALGIAQVPVARGADATTNRREKGARVALSIAAAAAPVALFCSLLYYRAQDREYDASLASYLRADRPDHARALRFEAVADRRSRDLAVGAVALAGVGVLVTGAWLFARAVSGSDVSPWTEDRTALPAALSVRF